MTGRKPNRAPVAADQAGRTYLVHMPLAEARHLAGTSPAWPAVPESRLAAALREWLAGISRRRTASIPVRTVVADLTAFLETIPLPHRPLRGPFGPGRTGAPLAGRAEYLGSGIVRLDDAAISSLAGLPAGDDFKVIYTDAGPVLTVGADRYLASEEQPGKP